MQGFFICTQWWLLKINRNKANNAKAARALKKDGWKVISIWECKLKSARVEKKLAALLSHLQ
jgi:DNA mismatch endonuclease (patch repair protein)